MYHMMVLLPRRGGAEGVEDLRMEAALSDEVPRSSEAMLGLCTGQRES